MMEGEKGIRVLIVDDHPIIRRGVREILADDSKICVVGEAGSGSEALRVLGQLDVDFVLLDVTLPDRSGIEVLKDIRQLFPWVRVLVLSIHPEEQYAVRALRAGALGYLTKESAPEELLRAIERVIRGGKYVTANIAESLSRLASDDLKGLAPHELLSDREFEVLRLLAQGHGVSQIAEKLGLSVKTVSTYRARILEKLGKETTAQLIRYAIDHHLV
jgi:DNA-binding NarL/FixJ family response regulator